MSEPRAVGDVGPVVPRQTNTAKSFVTSAELADESPAPVRAAVVDEEHFELIVGARKERVADRLLVQRKSGLLIVDGRDEDDSPQWSSHSCRQFVAPAAGCGVMSRSVTCERYGPS